MYKRKYETTLAGKVLTATFTDLAENADGSVLISYGETVVLVTAVMGKSESNLNYFPLSVEYEEKFYAAGEILGSRFMRREGRPSDEAILSARIVDRTIRPLFPPHLRREVQVVVTVLAVGEDDPDILSVVGTSLALGTSVIPWNGPVSAVRLIQNDKGEVSINPNYLERQKADFETELICCGQNSTINMIEAAAKEVSENDLMTLLETAMPLLTKLENWQKDIIDNEGKEKITITETTLSNELIELFLTQFASRLHDTIFSGQPGKDHIYRLEEEFLMTIKASGIDHDERLVKQYWIDRLDEIIHTGAVESGKRADGRSLDAVRPLFAEAGGISPVLHGSGTFYRGGTHIFTALTLGGPEAAQLIDTMEERSSKKRFMHHYNFPPFSVGETGRVGGFNRRMIGHGALAEKALLPVLPEQADFPYTIRLVSETLSSNGSSSMGSVCASTLALMDGGVPIKRPVAGIASGLMMMGDRYALLTDIQGPEDEFGDMDFKVAGTTDGITAIQMDVKLSGVPLPILREALDKALVARLEIIKVIQEAINAPRPHLSPRAPEIVSLQINPDQIGLVIGSGGKTINGIKDETGAGEISIEDDGMVYITGKNGTAKAAAEKIKALTKRYQIGDRAEAIITKVVEFGAFAALDQYNEGLIHVSEIAPFRIENVASVLRTGMAVPVVVSKIDAGKIGLSIKQANPDFIKSPKQL